jgi:hypothetical protein
MSMGHSSSAYSFEDDESQRQRDRRQQDDQLPSPEHETGQAIGQQAGLAGALHDIQGGGEQRGTAEGENHRVGMQRTQASV